MSTMATRLVLALAVILALAGWCGMAGPALAAHGEAAHGEATEGGGGGLNPLNVKGKGDLALWTAVIFLTLLVVLWKFAWRPIADGLDKRERRIADEISSAETANREAKQLLVDYQRKLAASEAEVRGILEQGRRDAEQVGRELVEKARAETDVEKQRALREIETATAGALKELAERSATLAVELAGKVLREHLDPKAHTRLIEEAVSRFAGSKRNGS